jgi:RNA polymerase sigma-70 factor, ECF subfamily
MDRVLHATTDSLSADDPALVRAALESPKNFGRLVQRYAMPLRRYLGRMLGSNARNAEDVLQEVFLKVYVNLNDYDQERPFAPWIYRIAHNEAINNLRQSKPSTLVIGGEDGELLMQNVAHDSDYASNPGLWESLQKAFANLGPAYRDVLILRLLEDKAYDEISEILAIPSGTVAIRIKRGLQRLQADLAGWKD